MIGCHRLTSRRPLFTTRQENYKPYSGDGSFLAGATQRTKKLWSDLEKLLCQEVRMLLPLHKLIVWLVPRFFLYGIHMCVSAHTLIWCDVPHGAI